MCIKKNTLLFLILCLYLTIPSPFTRDVKSQRIDPFTIDHAKDKKKANEWAEKYYNSWKKKLTKAEKKSLSKLLEPLSDNEEENFENINHQLKVYGGDLSERPVDIPKKNKILSDHVERITKILNYKESKLQQPIVVYKNEALEDIIPMEDEECKNPDGTLNEDKLAKLRTDFLYSQHREFRIYDLFEDQTQDQLVKWKIELPAGTSTGLLEENKIIIDKDSAFKVTSLKTILQKGKQLIKIEAKLVPKKTVEDEITQLTDNIQKKFSKQLDLSKEMLDFKLVGSGNFFIAKKIPNLLDEFISSLHPKLLDHTLAFISAEDGYFILTDRELYTLPPVFEPYKRTLKRVKQVMNVAGNFNMHNRVLSFHLPDMLQRPAERMGETLLHEFGHAVDHYGAYFFDIEEDELSETNGFQEIFAKEGNNLTEYGSTHPAEFFAEAFWMIHTTGEKDIIKKKAPQTYEFISMVLEILVKG